MNIVECKMPDLSDLAARDKKVVNHFLACHMVGVGVGFPEKLGAYRTNLARLADKAVSEYECAREYVLADVEQHKCLESSGRIYVLSIANELENCIITTWRLLMHFEDIKSDKLSPTIDKILRKQIFLPKNDITNIRDAVVHMDDDIRNGKKQSTGAIVPVLNSDATEIRLLSHVLRTETLASTIRRIHGFAYEFMEYRVGASPA